MAKSNKIVLDLTIDGIESTKSKIDGLVSSMSSLKSKITELESKRVLTQSDIDKLDRYKKSMSENIQKHSELTTTLTTQQKALASNIESTTRLENAQKRSASVANTQKTAFDAVAKSIGLASTTTDGLTRQLLNMKVPSLNFDGVSQSALAATSQISRQASGFGDTRITEEQFINITKAAYGTKDTIEEVTLAVQQFRNIMENTSGANSFTANTAALIGLQNQIKATGGSISSMNKEISNIQKGFDDGDKSIKGMYKTYVSFSDLLKTRTESGMVSVSSFSDKITKAKQETELLKKSLEYAFGDSVKKVEILNEQIKVTEDEIKKIESLTVFDINIDENIKKIDDLNIQLGALKKNRDIFVNNPSFGNHFDKETTNVKEFETSIEGLTGRLDVLNKEFRQLTESERNGVVGEEMLNDIKKLTDELSTAESKLNDVGATLGRTNLQGSKGLSFLQQNMTQVARELPNFFISPQIGFMSISNNLPMLGDAWAAYKKAVSEAGETQQSFGKIALSSLTNLGGALTILSGLFIAFGDTAIKYIIDKLNEIPKSLEIKLELYEKTGEQIKTYLEKVNELKNDIRVLNTLHGKSHSTRLAEIKEKMVNEKIATEKELENIKAKDLANSEYFKRYLRYQTDLAFNTELFKKRAENEAQLEVKKAQLMSVENELVNEQASKSVRKSLVVGQGGKTTTKYTVIGGTELFDTEEEAKASASNGILDNLRKIMIKERKGERWEWVTDIFQTDVAQRWIDIVREINKLTPELRDFNKIKPRDAFKPLDKKEDGGGKKSSSSEVTPGLISVDGLKDVKKNNDTWAEYEAQIPKDMEFNINLLHQQDLNNKQRIEGYDKWFFGNINKNNYMETQMSIKEESARREDLSNEQVYYQEKKLNLEKWLEDNKNLQTDYQKFKEEYDKQKGALDSTATILETEKKRLLKDKDLLDEISNKMKLSTDKNEKEKLKTQYNTLAQKLQDDTKVFNNTIEFYNKDLESFKVYTDKKTELEKRLKKGEDVSAELNETNTKLNTIGSAIVNSQRTTAELTRKLWNDALDGIKDGIGGVGFAFNSVSQVADNLMKIQENRFKVEKENLIESDAYNKASSEEQEQMVYDLEMKKYNAMKQTFEFKKMADAGSAITSGLLAEVEAVRNLVGNGGAISPLAWSMFAVESALIATTTVANVSEIMSRKLDKPSPPKKGAKQSGGGGGATTANTSVALTPNKDSLTSNDEILNSQKPKQQTNIVRVSEINHVQKKTEVRDNLSKY